MEAKKIRDDFFNYEKKQGYKISKDFELLMPIAMLGAIITLIASMVYLTEGYPQAFLSSLTYTAVFLLAMLGLLWDETTGGKR